MIVVLLVHSQRSYIENVTEPSANSQSANLSTALTQPTLTGRGDEASARVIRSIEIGIHEIHAVNVSKEWRN